MLKRGKYLQIAFNRPLSEVKAMIGMLPPSERILIEAGTPLIKNYGGKGIAALKSWWAARLGEPRSPRFAGETGQERDLKTDGDGYIVADLKCMDRGSREVDIAAKAGASAITCLGLAPTETIDEFIENCENAGIDSMIDMMNVPFPFEILQKLKKLPKVIVLHRGVDERYQKEVPEIPYRQIAKIKSTWNVLVSIAGGEDFRDVRRAIFNGADIAVVWEKFYQEPKKVRVLSQEFLKEIR